MKEEIIILNEDKEFAKERIAELQQQIQDLGPEFYDVFNQSSETWHDNAPFDALRDRQSVLDAELQQLRRILRTSAISVPRIKRGVVGIGSVISLSDGRRYRIAGDWTPHAGQMHDGNLVISCKTPLALQLIGKKLGDTVVMGRTNAVIKSLHNHPVSG